MTLSDKYGAIYLKIHQLTMSIPWWAHVILLWVLVVSVLTGIGIVSLKFVDLREGYHASVGVPPAALPGLWARWDSGYYLGIARSGYSAIPNSYGFFPLYPSLIAILSRVFRVSLATSGLIISSISYLGAAILIYLIALRMKADQAYAFRSVVFLLVFPSAFFFIAIYAESLTLVLSLLAVYFIFLPKPKYAISGSFSGLSALVRPTGFLVYSVALVKMFTQKRYHKKSVLAASIGLMLSFLGIAFYVLFVYSQTGSWFEILESTAAWQRQLQIPIITYLKSLRIVFLGNNVPDDWFLYVINIIDLIFTSFAIAITSLAIWKSRSGKFNWGLTTYMICYLVIMLSSQGLEVVPLWGMTRWVALLFPMYFILADLFKKTRSFLTVSGLMMGIQIVFVIWWVSGRWIG